MSKSGSTVVASGSPNANKIFNAALFVEACRRNTFTNMLTGGAPKSVSTNKVDPRKQTESGAPIVRITDLSKNAGDEVTMDLFHQLSGRPTMGDRKLAGRVESMSQSSVTMHINQGRHAVSSGGRMTQQRTSHDLKRVAKSLIGPWWSKLDDQLMLCQLAGARGYADQADWMVPLESDEEFNEIIVNPLTPPTFDRHHFGGDATSFETLDSSDRFDLSVIDNMRLRLDEMAYPLQPIQFENDPGMQDDPFYILLVTPRQWHDFTTSTDANRGGKALRDLQASAATRASIFKHPIFTGETAMWNGILIKKMSRSITFPTGSTATVCTNTANATTTQVTAGTKIERGLLLGAQALGNAFGRVGGSEGGSYFKLHSEPTDHENEWEHSIWWMNGKKKIRFKGTDGRINDHGVMAVDTAVS